LGLAIACGYRLKVEVIVALIIFLMDGLQELYAMNKIGLSDNHHQIDGVKIFLTAKASGQIGLWVYRGIISVAQGTKKTKAAPCHPTGNVQRFFDKHLNADLVAQGVKLAGGKAAFGHVSSPGRVWASG
jgi:hypothetical protein